MELRSAGIPGGQHDRIAVWPGRAFAAWMLIFSVIPSIPVQSAAGKPTGLRSAADRKAFRRTAIRTDAIRPIRPCGCRTVPAGGAADSKPLFMLHGVSVTGAQAIPRDQIATAYQAYLGKKVSQADLAAIAASHQRPLSRGRVSPQPRDRAAAGHQGRPGSYSGDRRQHHRSGAEGRWRGAIRHTAAARPGSGGMSLATGDAGTPAAADQRPAGRAHRRHRAGRDRQRDRPFPPHRLS